MKTVTNVILFAAALIAAQSCQKADDADTLMLAEKLMLAETLATTSIQRSGADAFAPVADAYVRNGSYANANYGTATQLIVKSDNVSYNRRSYLLFDFPAVSDSLVTNALLTLRVSGVNTPPNRTISVYATDTDTWGEHSITWNNAPVDTVYIGDIAISGTGSYSIDVTDEINRQLAASDRKASFLLMDKSGFDPSGHISLVSKEGILNDAPSLSITHSGGGATDVEKLLADYELVWNDEFDGTALDTGKWSYRANGSVRHYATVDGNRTISLDGNGNLVIRVTKEGNKYYVGQVTTDGHFNPKYGYFECRAKMNKYIGPHIAFWLQSPTMGNQPYNNPAVNGAEIDIFEYHRKTPGQIWQTIHINGYAAYHQSQGKQIPYPTVDTGYHTFGLLWTDSVYQFFIDGYKTHETSFGLSQRTEYMILSTELTGFGGDPALGSYPDSVVYDYVRVYQPLD